MGREKREPGIVILSSDDEGEAKRIPPKKSNRGRLTKSAPGRNNSKRAKRASTSSFDRLRDVSNGFDEVKRFCEEFDRGFTQFKVTSDTGSNSLWVEKYKPTCLEELAVHKKKVEEVKTWFEGKLKNSEDTFGNVILMSGQAGVGKSATIHAIACHFGAEVHEWNTPTPTLWSEHLHSDGYSQAGIRYISKLDEFESFVEKIRKYGLLPSSLGRASPKYVILLIDDLPAVNGKVAFGRLHRSLHLLLQSVRLPTAILFNDLSRSESADNYNRYYEELQSSLQHAGACKVMLNPITVNSIRKTLSRICRMEQVEVSDEQIDAIAKASEGDIRNAITSLQYLCRKTSLVHSTMARESLFDRPRDNGDETSHLYDGISQVGKDATLSLFHALGKFLHNKRDIESTATSGKSDNIFFEFCELFLKKCVFLHILCMKSPFVAMMRTFILVKTITLNNYGIQDVESNGILLKEKYQRSPLRMDAPEVVLSQAHGQARPITDFLHENILDFVGQEAIDDASVIAAYLSDTDLLLSPFGGTLTQNFNTEKLMQSSAASVAARGVLFGNAHPMSARWHCIRRPMLWKVEQSMRQTKHQIMSQRRNVGSGLDLNNFTVMATEFKPAHSWLGHGASEEHQLVCNEDEEDGMSLNEMLSDDDEIEDW